MPPPVNDPISPPITKHGNKLSYICQDATSIPSVLYKLHGKTAFSVDLSHNALHRLTGLEFFTEVEELVLDNNRLDDDVKLPFMENLHTLSMNNNRLVNLESILTKIKRSAPNIKYLSLLGNLACPSPLSHSDKDESDYRRYRCYVLHCLPSLDFLDYSAVTIEEREEGLQRGQYMKIARPQYVPQLMNDEELMKKGNFTPLPPPQIKSTKGKYGKCDYRYNGLHSEGNRFIRNHDL